MIRVAPLLAALALVACGSTMSPGPSGDGGTVCASAGDCHGPLPEIACMQCPDGGNGCPRWLCVDHRCQIATGCELDGGT